VKQSRDREGALRTVKQSRDREGALQGGIIEA